MRRLCTFMLLTFQFSPHGGDLLIYAHFDSSTDGANAGGIPTPTS